jgi:hypothetical protein
MTGHRRFAWWPWTRRHRARHAVLVAAEQANVAAQQAARRRIIDAAYRDHSPRWDAPTAVYRPLMTRGQAARGHGGRR